MAGSDDVRPLTNDEHRISRWMLENSGPEAREYLSQLEVAVASTWRCPCGCASFNFLIPGRPKPPPGVNTLGDFMFGRGDELSGIFIYSSDGTLSGVEVYALGGDAPTRLPDPDDLRPAEFSEPAQNDT